MNWWRRRKLQRQCFHHDMGGNPANSRTAISWIQQRLIDTGRKKMFWCNQCDKTWFS